jgi:MIP family channel proteins
MTACRSAGNPQTANSDGFAMVNSRISGRAGALPPGRVQLTFAPGLHGHQLHGNAARAVTAEAVGTFFLVLIIGSTVIEAALGRPVVGAPYGSMTIPLVAGMVLAALTAGFGPVSGAHLNPAVTVALAAHGRFPWRLVPAYAVAQFAGAIAAALVSWACFGDRARSAVALGATLPGHGVGAWEAFGTETAGTVLLVLVVMSVAGSAPGPAPAAAAVPIGFTLAATIFAFGSLSGAGVNPARALGPMIVAGRLTDWWCYLLGPLAGALAAVALYERVFKATTPPAAPAAPDIEREAALWTAQASTSSSSRSSPRSASPSG